MNPVSLLQRREGQEGPPREPPRPQLARGGVVQRACTVGALKASCPVPAPPVLLRALAAVHAYAVHTRAAQHVYFAILACVGRGSFTNHESPSFAFGAMIISITCSHTM